MLLSRDVYNRILEQLLAGELLPGQIINRRQIASEFGVSVAPVLEAMLLLEHEGLLETIPRKGTQVRLVRPEDVLGQFMIRDAIESKAARLYWNKGLKNNSEDILDFAQQVDGATQDLLDDWRQEILFHKELVSLAGIPALTAAFDKTMKLNLFFTMTRTVPEDKKNIRDNHVVLIQNLLKAVNTDEAESIIRTHVWFAKDYLLEGQPQI
ncbi:MULTISPECIES: GntR family transcriptional regulator [unclassified Oceanispirochaeta]|uniref:GntR family transcriptional regulator n=1 Tax=unclassified Oceanispirochaeta TaxID=2635722 RepID=UPI000E091EC9|nr:MULTISPECIES: GntR family transcriptional regulator [unclassified Oceanispirochaeta]MBF9014304.1 GntR family transcriptional regulator [Oceanispirochaeta sp. M2]NPD71190.1 GntR family transcriptional regulator [Oceanispirochaeta sp. M1]RDG33580.1 GntR family transcriptional regulator [Oceanispirochaeta sp. M1]